MPKQQPRAKSKPAPKSAAALATDHAPPSPVVANAAAALGARPAPQSSTAVVAGTRADGAGDRAAQKPPAKTIYCTITTGQNLPRALRLRDSIVAAQGPVDFRLLLVEHPAVVARLRAQLPAVPVLGPDALGCPQWLHMAFYYGRQEYCAALKAAFLRTLLADGNVVYFDPEIEIFSSLSELETMLQESDVVLTPYASELPPADGGPAAMKDLRRRGQFDLGFLAVSKGEVGERLLSWWQQMLVEGALNSESDGPGNDQLWASVFIAAAPRLKILRSTQYNLLARSVGQLAASPYQSFAQLPYSFASYTDGTPIPDRHRRALGRLPLPNRRAIYNPFAEGAYFAQFANQEPIHCLHCLELEGRLNRLPYSLIGYAGKVADLVAPGVSDRVATKLQSLSPQNPHLRRYATKALDLLMPGSSYRIHNALKAAAASDNPTIRRAATVMLGTVGARG